MPMGHVSFGASHVRLQLDTGHLVPTAETCSRRWRSGFLAFEQCHGEVLRSAVSTIDRARPSVPQPAAASPGNDASGASSSRFGGHGERDGVAHESAQGGKAKHRGPSRRRQCATFWILPCVRGKRASRVPQAPAVRLCLRGRKAGMAWHRQETRGWSG